MLIRLLLASTALVAVAGTALAQTDTTNTEYGIVKSWQDKDKTLPITPGESTPVKPVAKTTTPPKPPTGAYMPPGGETNPATATGRLVRLANGQYIPATDVKPWMKLWKDKKTAAAGGTK